MERYANLIKIAAGGMAEIFRATQYGREGFARPVIIKRIRPVLAGDARFRDALLDEANLAMTFSHGNIVPVLDVGQAGGLPFLVLELVDGWDLSTILRRARKAELIFPLSLALYITAEVCRGLAYVHSRRDPTGEPLGIIHRDVGPRNVLISHEGEVKLTDFGVAKARGRREKTLSGYIKGHPDFMSPEQAAGASLTAASDIFTVGSMLYLLATGQAPFAADNEYETLLKVQQAEFMAPENLQPPVPPPVARIITRAMQREPAQRYPDAGELMRDLEALLRKEFPAGHSDLARWLAELAARDGELPTSQMPSIAEPGEPAVHIPIDRLAPPNRPSLEMPVPVLTPRPGTRHLMISLALLVASALGAAWALPSKKRAGADAASSAGVTAGKTPAAAAERGASARVRARKPKGGRPASARP